MVIHSDLELPELRIFDAPAADLVFRRSLKSRARPVAGEAIYEFGEGEAYIGLGGIGQFIISGPQLVEYTIDPDADRSLFSLVLLGSVLATVLHFRNLLTLHASGVEVNGGGVVFLGDKGAGKSTTAAAFVQAGHKLLTDDVLPIEVLDNAGRILPGFPQVKLSRPAADTIALPYAASSRIGNCQVFKNRLRLADHFMAKPLPARTLYVLARGEPLGAWPMPGVAALAALMRNAYHTRFGTEVFHGAAAAQLLRRCAGLLASVSVKLLVIPDGIPALSELVAFVEKDNA
jgi:hypothetical protein